MSVALAALIFFLNIFETRIWSFSASDYSILDSAEKFFISLKEREYKSAWDLLSEHSHETIINDIYKTSKGNGIDIREADIITDFNHKGLISSNYWNAFTGRFDPDIVLNERVWEFGKIESDHAVILFKGKAVTELQMYKENNQWKVGLVETFWTRKPLNFIKQVQSLLTR